MANDQINTFKTLDEVFGVNPTPVESLFPASTEAPVNTSLSVVSSVSSNDFPSTNDLMDDYQTARNAMRNLLDKGEKVVDNMLSIAVQTESARSFEVAGNLIKTMAEVAKDLVNLHEQTNKAKKKTDEKASPATPQVVQNTQNNVVFQGSTTDLFNMMNGE